MATHCTEYIGINYTVLHTVYINDTPKANIPFQAYTLFSLFFHASLCFPFPQDESKRKHE